MMFAENRKISLRQLQVLLLLDCFGTALLFLPAELAALTGKACWLAALAGGAVFVLCAVLLAYAGARMPDGTAVEWFRSAFGKGIGTLLLLGLAAKLLFDGALELRIFSEIICRTMLPNTPVWVISLVILAVAGTLAAQGTECCGRAAEILFFVVAIPLVVVLAAVAISAEYGRIRPVALPSAVGLKDGVFAMSLVFQGLVPLYFLFPDLKKAERAAKAVCISSIITAVTAVAIVFLCLAVYGAGVLSGKMLPTLQMMERVSFTGIFLTRQDVLLLWFWMASVCIFLSGILFCGIRLGVRLFCQAQSAQKIWLWLWLAALFAAAFLPENLSAAYRLRLSFAPWLHLFYFLVLPFFFCIFGKGGKRDA